MNMTEIEIKANLGLIIRGDIKELSDFADELEELLDDYDDLILVHNHLSANKLWIQDKTEPDVDGDELNGNESDNDDKEESD